MNVWIYYALLAVFCFLIFLFSFWRYLKEDYIPSQIFSTAFVTGFFTAVSFISLQFFKDYFFWILILSINLGYLIGSRRSGIKYYEGFDALIASLTFSLIPTGLILIRIISLPIILSYLMILGALIIFYLLRRQYKTFIWYKSARRGFCGLFSVGVFFLTRALLTIYNPDYIIFLTEYDIIISGLISLTSFLNIFILARS